MHLRAQSHSKSQRTTVSRGQNKAIYGTQLVKSAVQKTFRRSSRTFPSPSASVDLPIAAGADVEVCAFSRSFSEPEAEGDSTLSGQTPSSYRAIGRRGVKRSTIYSGFRAVPPERIGPIAMKKTYEGRRHSTRRRLTMGSPSGFVPGSSLKSPRPPSRLDQYSLIP